MTRKKKKKKKIIIRGDEKLAYEVQVYIVFSFSKEVFNSNFLFFGFLFPFYFMFCQYIKVFLNFLFLTDVL